MDTKGICDGFDALRVVGANLLSPDVNKDAAQWIVGEVQLWRQRERAKSIAAMVAVVASLTEVLAF